MEHVPLEKTTERKKKNRCVVCSKSISVLKMDCKKCCKSFCLKHFLPEAHECTKLAVDDDDVPRLILPPAIRRKKIEKI